MTRSHHSSESHHSSGNQLGASLLVFLFVPLLSLPTGCVRVGFDPKHDTHRTDDFLADASIDGAQDVLSQHEDAHHDDAKDYPEHDLPIPDEALSPDTLSPDTL
ncbi:MAG: hypothetical protein KAI47_17755, partial [Deltaproteobacteria bacterium]|nr:hypothetical protein [Deltaproteobacteria bacterium]